MNFVNSDFESYGQIKFWFGFKGDFMKEVLITGGAGYIGSHVARVLHKRGFKPLIYDNLVNGFREFVRDFEFIKGDIGDYKKLLRIFKKREICAVMNFASFIAVGESVKLPLMYYENNVADTLSLFRAMIDSNIKSFIFSSTAAVYGYPDSVPIVEESQLRPINPYGNTKYFIEKVLHDLDVSDDFKSISLRYFNASGADPSGEIGESHTPETHLIPLVMRSLIEPGYKITIFGTDYDTPDGTCIRDYIHVNDLASAHVLALESLLQNNTSRVYNLGNGKGFSVREVIDSVKRVTGKIPSFIEGERREGDPAVLVASSELAKKELGWEIEYNDLDDIINTAWKWESLQKRKGY